jgi:hypothetical protein
VTTDGVERTVHKFTGDPDGAAPWAGLIDAGGKLAWGIAAWFCGAAYRRLYEPVTISGLS